LPLPLPFCCGFLVVYLIILRSRISVVVSHSTCSVPASFCLLVGLFSFVPPRFLRFFAVSTFLVIRMASMGDKEEVSIALKDAGVPEDDIKRLVPKEISKIEDLKGVCRACKTPDVLMKSLLIGVVPASNLINVYGSAAASASASVPATGLAFCLPGNQPFVPLKFLFEEPKYEFVDENVKEMFKDPNQAPRWALIQVL